MLLAVALAAFLTISGRLVTLQVLDGPSLDRAAARQRLRTIELPAERGRVFDRNFADLALSVDARTVYAQPRFVTDPARVAARLAPILRRPAGELARQLASKRTFVYLARKVPPGVGDAVARLGEPGLGVLGDSARRYPSGSLAAQVLGWVNVDGVGGAGVEQQYDAVLRGQPGSVLLEEDPSGRPLPGSRRSLERPRPGSDIVLTIDQPLQYQAEQALAAAVRQFHAKGGAIIVQVPATGEILAMGNVPAFDPNQYGSSKPEARVNRAVADAYEPGSVNKTITAAAALQAGVVTPSTRITIPPSLPLCPGKTFHDAEPHGTETLPFAQVVAQSSNIGTIKVASRLGAHRLGAAELAFGYGRRTGVGLPGESAGIVVPARRWACTDLAVNAIGQGVAVTLLQMATVYATVANGGVRVPPTIVRGVVDDQGRLEEARQAPGRRVIAARTAHTLTTILEQVVEAHGTGTLAALDDYTVAGKTGTARKPDQTCHCYRGGYMSSFIGFAPASNPAVVVAVVLDEPTPIFGGIVAAPTFKLVAEAALHRLGVPPDRTPPAAPDGPTTTTAPDRPTTTTGPDRPDGTTTTTGPDGPTGPTTTNR